MHYNTVEEIDRITNILNLFEKINMDFVFSQHYFENKIKLTENLLNSFDKLDYDEFYTNKRKRAFSLVKFNENDNNIYNVGNLNFFQGDNLNSYNGNILRNYNNISEKTLKDDTFKYIFNTFKNTVDKETKKNNEYFQIHQIRVYANEDNINLVPEGIHQDGFNIVGICCIKRNNIIGGINNVYDENKNIIYSKQLFENEMIILNDNKVYHDVSPIKSLKIHKDKKDKKDNISYRDIFVFTSIS